MRLCTFVRTAQSRSTLKGRTSVRRADTKHIKTLRTRLRKSTMSSGSDGVVGGVSLVAFFCRMGVLPQLWLAPSQCYTIQIPEYVEADVCLVLATWKPRTSGAAEMR
ncbi:hypothetical protein PV04_03931 [Phialophora macrospora]|uniref:Uncharacterized protein n=1 Tax=Phialophora macrospora TaxID=1851006 RepID=A0A0D2E0T1_9EURO|nr:hypothetical protein PV04_03931 [Phialophora macrospora]